MLTQKLYRNGNSIAITIPRQYLEDLNLKEGSEIVVEKEGDSLRITAKKSVLASDVNTKFMKMLDSIIKMSFKSYRISEELFINFHEEEVRFAIKVDNERLTLEQISKWLRDHSKTKN